MIDHRHVLSTSHSVLCTCSILRCTRAHSVILTTTAYTNIQWSNIVPVEIGNLRYQSLDLEEGGGQNLTPGVHGVTQASPQTDKALFKYLSRRKEAFQLP